MSMPISCARLALSCALLSLLPCSFTADWLHYRGPRHDGSTEESVRLNWTEKPPKVLWTTELSPGLSSFSISGGRLFTQGRRLLNSAETEFCIALNAKTGNPLWSAPIGRAQYDGGVNDFGEDGDGPRSTPAIDGTRLYVLGSYLNLHCFDATTGEVFWSRDLIREFGSTIIPWQNAASPLVVDDLVLVNANAGSANKIIAFNKTNGVVAWSGHNESLTHATPVLATIGGTRQAIFFTQAGLLALEPLTGNFLWRFPLNYNGTSVAASPVVDRDTVYASRAYPGTLSRAQAGAILLKIEGSASAFTASKLWMKTNALMNHWATPVRYNGHIYGIFGQGVLKFQCIDAADGAIKWSQDGLGYGSVILAKDHLLAIGDKGQVRLVDPNPETYTELGRIQPIQGKCWNSPILSDGVLYLRSTRDMVALDVKELPPVAWKLQLGKSAEGVLKLTMEKTDGSAIDPSVTNKIAIFATSDLLAPLANWTRLSDAPGFFDGKLQLESPEGSSTQPQRFYRTEELP